MSTHRATQGRGSRTEGATPGGGIPRQRSAEPLTVGDLVAQVGWTPGERAGPARGERAAHGRFRRDGRAMTALRVVTYVLVALASATFLALVCWAGVQYLRGAPVPGLTGTGLLELCRSVVSGP